MNFLIVTQNNGEIDSFKLSFCLIVSISDTPIYARSLYIVTDDPGIIGSGKISGTIHLVHQNGGSVRKEMRIIIDGSIFSTKN
jgi:hypothetical protein